MSRHTQPTVYTYRVHELSRHAVWGGVAVGSLPVARGTRCREVTRKTCFELRQPLGIQATEGRHLHDKHGVGRRRWCWLRRYRGAGTALLPQCTSNGHVTPSVMCGSHNDGEREPGGTWTGYPCVRACIHNVCVVFTHHHTCACLCQSEPREPMAPRQRWHGRNQTRGGVQWLGTGPHTRPAWRRG